MTDCGFPALELRVSQQEELTIIRPSPDHSCFTVASIHGGPCPPSLLSEFCLPGL